LKNNNNFLSYLMFGKNPTITLLPYLNHLKGYPSPLCTIIKVSSLLGLLIHPLVPEKAAMSGDLLKEYTALEAP
jgi:hypothetical protein